MGTRGGRMVGSPDPDLTYIADWPNVGNGFRVWRWRPPEAHPGQDQHGNQRHGGESRPCSQQVSPSPHGARTPTSASMACAMVAAQTHSGTQTQSSMTGVHAD